MTPTKSHDHFLILSPTFAILYLWFSPKPYIKKVFFYFLHNNIFISTQENERERESTSQEYSKLLWRWNDAVLVCTRLKIPLFSFRFALIYATRIWTNTTIRTWKYKLYKTTFIYKTVRYAMQSKCNSYIFTWIQVVMKWGSGFRNTAHNIKFALSRHNNKRDIELGG